MSAEREIQLKTCLEAYADPWLRQTLGKARAVRSVRVSPVRAGGGESPARAGADKADAVADLVLGFPAADYVPELAGALNAHARALPWLEKLEVRVTWEILAHAVQKNLQPIQSIKNVVAVASGKGGVGKSTVAANLALAWAAQGAKVGMLDADIYGPSQPRMLGLAGKRPQALENKRLEPLFAYGLEVMSIGFLIDEEQPMVWRGPMVTQALTQLLNDTQWGALDYLVVDMPPGTGDVQLTLSQRVPVAGAVIVTTPQDIALADARKGLKMFEKVSVPVLGIVENMSTHICSNCGHEEQIFGTGGGARMASEYNVELLGTLPLDIHIREQADGGRPTVAAEPDSPRARAYREMARRTAARLAMAGRDYSKVFPKITVEDS